jgi:hypothetical protein
MKKSTQLFCSYAHEDRIWLSQQRILAIALYESGVIHAKVVLQNREISYLERCKH